MKGPAQLPSTTASSGSAASYMEGFDEKKWEADWKRIYPNYSAFFSPYVTHVYPADTFI